MIVKASPILPRVIRGSSAGKFVRMFPAVLKTQQVSHARVSKLFYSLRPCIEITKHANTDVQHGTEANNPSKQTKANQNSLSVELHPASNVTSESFS